MNAVISPVLTFLLNACWQVTVVALSVAVCVRIIRRLPSSHQHALWVLALLLSLGLPLWSVYNLPSEPGHAPARLTSTPAGPSVQLKARDASLLRVGEFDIQRQKAVALRSATRRGLLLAYLAFLFCASVRLWRAWRLSGGIRRTAFQLPLSDGLAAIVARCQRELEIPQTTILWSNNVLGPVTVGIRDPVIVLPIRLHRETNSAVLTSVVGHEIAHMKRGDCQWNTVCEMLALPIAFHPAAAWIKRQIRASREQACDELVAQRLLNVNDYARSLISIAQSMSGPSQFSYTMGVLGIPSLEERVMRLMEQDVVDKRGRVRLFFAMSVLGLVGGSLVSSVFSLALAQQTEKPGLPSGPLSALAESTSSAESEQHLEAYTYRSHGKRDPFVGPRVDVGSDFDVASGPPGFTIDSLKLQGIVKTTRGYIVMLLGPDSKTYFVKVGQAFRDGTLVAVNEDTLRFRVQNRDPRFSKPIREVTLKLHPVETAK